MTEIDTTTIPFTLTNSMHDEYIAREIDAPIYDRLIAGGPGKYRLTIEEAKEMWDDADYYCDPYGPAESLSFGMKMAYRSVRKAIARELGNINVNIRIVDNRAEIN